MQQVIQIMLAKERKNLEGITSSWEPQEEAHIQQMTNTHQHTARSQNEQPSSNTSVTPPPAIRSNRICHATKCRLLRAKGIISRPMKCIDKKHMCAGCMSESIRHKKTKQIEMDLLHNMAANDTMAPLMDGVDNPISLRQLRTILTHLPTLQNTHKRDDHIYGATRYTANTLGLKLDSTCTSENVDPSPTDKERKTIWRMANFQCRCQPENRSCHQFGVRNFCRSCQYPIYYTQTSHLPVCPVCLHNDPWQHNGDPCLACKVAAIVYRNPFQDRLQQQMELWLHQDYSDNDTDVELDRHDHTLPHHCIPNTQQVFSDEQLLNKRNKMFYQTFAEIRSRATPRQSKTVLEGLSALHHSIRQNGRAPNDDHDPTNLNEPLDSSAPSRTTNAPRTLNKLAGPPTRSSPRLPLQSIDTNSMDSITTTIESIKYIGIHKRYRAERIQMHRKQKKKKAGDSTQIQG